MDSKLIRNYFYNFLNQTVVLLVPFLTAPYLSRVLGVENLGIYGYISSVYSLVTTIGLLGLNNYGVRQLAYVRNSKDERNKVFSQLLFLRLFLLIITTAIFAVIALCSDYQLYFSIEYILVIAVFVDVSWVFIGMEDMRIVASRNTLSKLLQLIAIIILVKGRDDLWIYFLSYPITTIIPTIYLLLPVRKYVKVVSVGIWSIFIHVYPAIKLYLPAVATTLLLQINKLMLKSFSNISSVAIYDQSEKIVTIPLAFITIVGTVMMPRIAYDYSNNNLQEINNNINGVLRMVLLLTFPMCVGLFLVSDIFIPWFLGKDFLPAISVIQLMCPLILFNALANISGAQYFVATNQTRIITRAYFIACIINLLGNLMLDSVLGADGATVSLVVSTSLCCLYQYYYLNKQLRLNISYLCTYIIAAVIMGGTMYIVKRHIFTDANILNTFLLIIVGIIIYAIILVAMRDNYIMKLLYIKK